METLFIQPEEQDNEPKIFEPKEDVAVSPAPLSERQKYTTSLLGALAKQWNETSDQTLASITGLIQNRINNGEEGAIRSEIADAQKQKKVDAISQEQLEALKRGEMGLDGGYGLKQLYEAQAALQTAPTNQYALEEEGVEAIQNLGAADPVQASGYRENADSLEIAHEAVSKAAAFNRFMNEKAKEVELSNAEWSAGFNPLNPGGNSVIESLLDMLWLPGQGWWTQTAATDKDTSYLPGYNLKESVSYLNSLPFDEYVAELPKVWDRLVQNSGLLKTNPTQALTALRRLGPTSDWGDAAMANFDAGFDVATSIPFAAAAKLARKPINIIQMAGNRKAAVQTAAAAIQKDAMGLPDSAAGGLGDLTAASSGAVEAAIPTYVKPDLMDYVTPWVGITSDVTDAVRNVSEAASRIPRMAVPGTTPEALQRNLQEYISTLETRYRRAGEDIADVHRVYPQPELPPLVGKAPRAVPEGLAGVLTPNGKISVSKIQQLYGVGYNEAVRYADRFSRILKNQGPEVSAEARIISSKMLKSGDRELDDAAYVGTSGRLDAKTTERQGRTGAAAEGHPGLPPVVVGEDGLPPLAGPELPPMVERLVKDKLDIELDSNLSVQTVSFYLGNGARPGGYLDAALAHEGARKRGLEGYGVVESNGQWYIKVTEIVPDGGSASIKSNDDLYPVNVWSQYLRNPQQVLPDLINDARLASVLERGNIESDVFAPIVKPIHDLSPKQTRRHNKIVTKGQDQEKVFKVDELITEYESEFGRGPSEKEVISYYAHIQANMASDAVIDDYLYGLRAKGGWVTGEINPSKEKDRFAGMFSETEQVRFSTNRMTMKEHHNPEWSSIRIFDFDENLTLHPGSGPAVADLRAKAQDKWKTGNYRLLELEEEIMHNGDPVTHVLVHKSSSRVSPLERRQRQPKPWGRKENLNKHFVTQARVGKYKGSEQNYALNPIVHLNERTATRAKERVVQLEEARLVWNKEGSYAALDEVARRKIIETAAESMEKWAKMVDEGIIQTNTPFRYVEDRQLPPEYENLPSGTQQLFNNEWTGSDRYYGSRRELYYQEPRDMLLDSSENRLRNLDPTRTLNRAINTAINTKAFANYNNMVIEDWVSRLPPGAIAESSVGYSKDPYTIFFKGRFTDQFKKTTMYQRLESNRRIHHRFMNYKNGEMKLRDRFNRTIAAWVDGKGTIKDKVATKFYDSMSRNPVDAVQGFVFDSYLGFYNPDQFFVQAQTAILAQTVHPIYGVQALSMSPWMTHLLLNPSENLLDFYAKRLKYIHGLPEDEFKLMFKSLNESGWMKVQGSLLQLDYLTNRVGGGRIGKAFGKFRRGGRVLFNMAERYNRLTGFQIAWHDVRKYNPTLKPGSPEFMVKVRQMTDGLTANMTAASKTAWQEGLASVPTKFLAYQAHVLENMLPKKFGGSTKLRNGQKFRLAAGQLALYGLGGGYGAYSLVDYIQDSYKTHTGTDMPQGSYELMTRGVFDAMVSTLGDVDTDMSSRVGFGAGMLNWYEKLTEGDFATSVDIFGGPTASLSSSWIDAFTRISRYVSSAPVHEITKEEWQLVGNEFMSSFKSWSRFGQFWAVYKSGQLQDKKTLQRIVPVGEQQAFAALLGFPMGAQTEFYREIKSEKKRGELADEIAQQLASLRRLGFKALEDGDDKASYNYNQSEGRIFSLIGDDYEMKRMVQRRLSQLLGYNDYNVDTMQQRVMQNQGRSLRAGRPQ